MRTFVTLSAIFFFKFALGQDLEVNVLNTPVTKCSSLQTANENVEIWLLNNNAAPYPGGFVDISYSINGAVPVIENVNVPAMPAFSVNTFTFGTQADLTVPGTYVFKVYIQSVDGNPTNDTLSTTVYSYALTVGGTALINPSSSAALTVCSGSNSGTIDLSGQTGNITRWEYSTDGGGSWTNIVNTTTTQAYNNLTTPTIYKTLVQSGTCPSTYSSWATFAIDPITIPGTLSGDATVCNGLNAGTLTLSGNTGNVIRWESSTDAGGSWTNIANTTTTHNYTNLTATTVYRAMVQSGVCSLDSSSWATITVDPVSVGGSVSANTTICSGSNSGTLTLSGQTGNVIGWEYSTNAGVVWTPIINTTATQNYTNLTSTSWYRAIVQSGVCSAIKSSDAKLIVDSASAGGALLGNATVCRGSNSGKLTLSAYTGKVLNWESSIDSGGIWSTIINTTDTTSYTNLIITTWYRAMVKNGVCISSDTSSIAIIVVDSATVPGIVSGNTTVCAGSNTGALTLSGYSGKILYWESSIDGGTTWVNIIDTLSTVTYTNLTATTWYRAINDLCLPDTSTIGIITVKQSCDVIISNLITLNGDGINDTWFIKNIEYHPSSQVYVYNVFGNEVFTSSSYNNDWDGTYKGNQLPDGTYYYILKLTYPDDVLKGTITIAREH